MVAGLPEHIASLTDQVAAGVLLAVAASAIVRPIRALLFFNAAWMAAVALAVWNNPGTTVDALAPTPPIEGAKPVGNRGCQTRRESRVPDPWGIEGAKPVGKRGCQTRGESRVPNP